MAVRIGVIGAGGIAGAHIEALEAVDDADIVAVCDVDQSHAASRARLAKTDAVFSDCRRMLDHVKVDAVWLCTPPGVRAGPIEACIERRIPVFTEKPVGDDLPAAEALAEKIERSGVPVMVGYLMRFMAITDRIKERLAGDTLSLVTSTYSCPMTLTYREGSGHAPWFYDKAVSGGAIVDQATHLFDLMRYLVGDVDVVYSVGSNCIQPKTDEYTVEDAYGVAFRFKNGVVGVHGHTWCHAVWRYGVTLYGTERAYTLNCTENRAEISMPGGETCVYQPTDVVMVSEDRHFVEMVKTGDFSNMRCSFADGVKTLALTKRILEVLDTTDE